MVGKPKSAFRQEVENDPKLRIFLDSVGHGSAMTRVAYLTAFVHFQRFLNIKYQGNTPSSILTKLLANEIDLYELLDGYISSLKGSPRSVRLNTEAVKSYLEYYDVEISSKKFKKRCRMPKLYRDDEEALTAPIIRKMLLTCNIRRLKAYILVLLVGALRAREALSIRNRDIYWDMKPVQIKIRKEYNKTRTAHFCFLTDEAAHYLKEWIDWKYRPERRTPKQKLDDDYVFATRKIGYKTNGSPTQIYTNILVEFNKLQDMCGFTERKDGMYRRKYTLHSFRRYTKTILSDNIGQDYSEWYLAHAKSSYWVRDIEHKSSEYIRVMKFLTFLDYAIIESTGKGIQNQLSEKDQRIESLEKQMKLVETNVREQVEQEFKTTIDDYFKPGGMIEKRMDPMLKEVARLKLIEKQHIQDTNAIKELHEQIGGLTNQFHEQSEGLRKQLDMFIAEQGLTEKVNAYISNKREKAEGDK